MIHAETSRDLSREERRDRYRDLARAVIELAWRDARADSRATDIVHAEAREFLTGDAAEVWADMAQFDLRRLRLLIEQEMPAPYETASPDSDAALAR